MKKVYILTIILIVSLFVLTGCTKKIKTEHFFSSSEEEFHINFPDNYSCLLYKSIVSIDSQEIYIVIKNKEEDYKLEYETQFFTDYASYNSFDIFGKIELAKYYFKNVISEDKYEYFVTDLDYYDWYAYEYTNVHEYTKKVDGSIGRVVRYVDLYVIHDKNEDILYIFYDKHQYPYDSQRNH